MARKLRASFMVWPLAVGSWSLALFRNGRALPIYPGQRGMEAARSSAQPGFLANGQRPMAKSARGRLGRSPVRPKRGYFLDSPFRNTHQRFHQD